MNDPKATHAQPFLIKHTHEPTSSTRTRASALGPTASVHIGDPASYRELSRFLLELEEGLLREAGEGGGDGEHEGGEAEWGVDGHQSRPEGRRRALAAQQHQKAEETEDELKKGRRIGFQNRFSIIIRYKQNKGF